MSILRQLPFAAMLALACATASANPPEGQEAGRLKACLKPSLKDYPPDTVLEIPYGAKFALPAAAGAQPSFAVQTNFVDAGVESVNRYPEGLEVKTQAADGRAAATVTMAGRHCLYLDAYAPVLQDKNLTWSASTVYPEWKDDAARKADKFTYRYFTSIDSTIYIESEVGKSLQYVAHESTNGYAMRDKSNNVDMEDNFVIRSMLGNAIREKLEEGNQYDLEIVDGQALGGALSESDVTDSRAVAKAIAEFKKNVAPPPKSRLIVVVPHRTQVRVPYRGTTIYGSKVEGMGFYVDLSVGVEGPDGTALGSFDVFMNCRAVLIDVDSGKVLADYDYANGKVFSAARSPNGSPFSALNGPEMAMTLNYIAADGANKILNEFLKK